MAKISPYTFWQSFDNNGDPLSGGLIYTYDVGTTTNKTTYTDSLEGTANANPIVLDANGRANIWLGSGSYKFVIKSSLGVLIDTVDNVVGDALNTFGSTVTTTSSNLSITDTYKNGLIIGTASLTLSLLAASLAGEGFVFSARNTGSSSITIDPDGTELINGSTTLILHPQQWAICICDGSNWYSLDHLGAKNNFVATASPTATDDSGSNYSVGSIWFNITNDSSYICLDATTTASIWFEFGSSNISAISKLTSAANKIPMFSGSGTATLIDFLDEDDLVSDSITATATQQSIKAYVDTNAPAWTYLASQTTTSGTTKDFTIGAGAEEFYITLDDVSLSDTSILMFQLGDSGGIETTSYKTSGGHFIGGSFGMAAYTDGYRLATASAAATLHRGSIHGILVDAATNLWECKAQIAGNPTYFMFKSQGLKALSAELTTVRLTRVGAGTFDNGVAYGKWR